MTDNNSTIITPMDDLIADWAEWKNGHGKSIAIVRSSSAIVSVIASTLLILMISKSKNRLSTTYHRLLLGMSVGDIFFSMGLATFQVMSPSDVSYMVWNARGNEATCSAQGFVLIVGWILSLFYSCSLNLYYVAMVKYNKTDSYIRTKIEPFLHGVPILTALVFSITELAKDNYHDDGLGHCTPTPIYNPPHCIGYDEGEVREGFKIPCGRGRDENNYFIAVVVFLFLCPIVIGVSLGMIYRAVKKQEKIAARYGVGALDLGAQQSRAVPGGSADSSERISGNFTRSSVSSVLSSIMGQFGRNSSPNSNGENSNRRAVLNKALAYSMSYLLAWTWPLILCIMVLAGMTVKADVPPGFKFVWAFLNPLQGLFNFLIFMHPKVVGIKKSQGGDLSWCQAFANAIRLRG